MISPEVFAARLNRSPGEAEERWQAEWSKKMADEMRRNAPVRTGALRNSIQATDTGAVATARYAAYVEYGTSRTAPRPFAGPSVNRLSKPAAAAAGKRIIETLT